MLEPGQEHQVGGFGVKPFFQDHPQDSYGYRLTHEGKVLVYSTDAERKPQSSQRLAEAVLAREDADLLVFDAQYAFRDTVESRLDWGHSSNLTGVDLAGRARVRHLCLFHHEPTRDDRQLEGLYQQTLRLAQAYRKMSQTPFPERVSMAHDGMELYL